MKNRKRFDGFITDVHGIRVGQKQDLKARTGVTVVRAGHEGAIVGVDVRGAAPGTRETDLCRPCNLVERANAVALCGGSAFGLAAADGVMSYLESIEVGMDMGSCYVPIVPAAVLYDLGVGDSNVRPTAEMGYEACAAATKEMKEGRVGAGTGATVGKIVPGTLPASSGIGTASITLACGVTVGAIAAVNAIGDVYDPRTNEIIACGTLPDGKPIRAVDLIYGEAPVSEMLRFPKPGKNTTISVLATDANLSKEQANRLAMVAHDGYARTINPVHTQMDGDTCFALATGRVDEDVNFMLLCMAAGEVMARAIYNAVIAGAAE